MSGLEEGFCEEVFPEPILKERVRNLTLALLVEGDYLLLCERLPDPVYIGGGVEFVLFQYIHAGELCIKIYFKFCYLN